MTGHYLQTKTEVNISRFKKACLGANEIIKTVCGYLYTLPKNLRLKAACHWQ